MDEATLLNTLSQASVWIPAKDTNVDPYYVALWTNEVKSRNMLCSRQSQSAGHQHNEGDVRNDESTANNNEQNRTT